MRGIQIGVPDDKFVADKNIINGGTRSNPAGKTMIRIDGSSVFHEIIGAVQMNIGIGVPVFPQNPNGLAVGSRVEITH